MKSVAPTSNAASIECVSSRPVIMATGTPPPPGSWRSAAQASKPSMSGMLTSISTRSGSSPAIAASAACPSPASNTWKPALDRVARVRRRAPASSSTTSMRVRGSRGEPHLGAQERLEVPEQRLDLGHQIARGADLAALALPLEAAAELAQRRRADVEARRLERVRHAAEPGRVAGGERLAQLRHLSGHLVEVHLDHFVQHRS